MKRMYVLAGLLALSMVALAFVATVAATEYGPTLIYTKKGKILTWHFDTYDTTHGDFSGDVIPGSIEAEWWDNLGIYTTVNPYGIVITQDYVELYFYKQDLPKSAAGSRVTGSLTTGDTFLASGPAWAWWNVH